MMKRILQEILAAYARAVLLFHKPMIIGITGSVGKSSTKEAIAHVLAGKFSVRASAGNLNSELGLPLAVLGFKKAGGHHKNFSSFLEWLSILILGFFKIFQLGYPKVLILEMGTDKPGDIASLISIVEKLDVAVITDIGISHMEFFKTPEALKKEKLSILSGLKSGGAAVLNADNEKVLSGKSQVRGECITYGFSDADIQVLEFQQSQKNNRLGISFKVNYKGNRVPFFVPDALGKPVVYAVLAAVACGVRFGMNLVEISQRVESFSGLPGRLKLLQGANSSTIIDDTYNAAPASTLAALEALLVLDSTRKLAAIGHMAELGNLTEEGHRQVAAKIVECGVGMVFLVGEKTKIVADELGKRNFSGKVMWFSDSDQAAPAVRLNLLPGDLILVKGSQSARMEKIVKAILRNPQKDSKLLVRQSADWLK